jgi:hypothetical protein
MWKLFIQLKQLDVQRTGRGIGQESGDPCITLGGPGVSGVGAPAGLLGPMAFPAIAPCIALPPASLQSCATFR